MNLSIPTNDEAAGQQRHSGVVGIVIGIGTSNHEGHYGANEGLEQEDRENSSSWKRRKMNHSCEETMDTGGSTNNTSTSRCAANEMDDDAMDFASNTSRGNDPFGAVARTAGGVGFPAGSVGTHSNSTTRMNTPFSEQSQQPPRRNSSREYCYYCCCYYCGCQEIALGQNRVFTSA